MQENRQRLTWASSIPVEVYIDTSVPSDFRPAIQKAVDIWNQAGYEYLGEALLFLEPYTGTPNGLGVIKIYYATTWSPSFIPKAEAVTTVYSLGARIYEANMYINGQDYKFDTQSTATPFEIDLESVVIHELGHAIGLAHDLAEDSVMQPWLSMGQIRDTLGVGNIKSLECGY